MVFLRQLRYAGTWKVERCRWLKWVLFFMSVLSQKCSLICASLFLPVIRSSAKNRTKKMASAVLAWPDLCHVCVACICVVDVTATGLTSSRGEKLASLRARESCVRALCRLHRTLFFSFVEFVIFLPSIEGSSFPALFFPAFHFDFTPSSPTALLTI